jgi:hypothetical protein
MVTFVKKIIKHVWSKEVSVCFAARELQQGYGADFWCAPSSIFHCEVSRSYLVSRGDVGGVKLMCDLG